MTLKSLDAVLPVSQATGRECVARGMPEGRVHVVPNGVDLDRFSGVFERRASEQRPTQAPFDALSDDAFLCVSVGRQVQRKGFAWFVDEVMPRLPEHVHYWLAGDGPERPAIRDAIDRRRLGDRVKMLGLVEERVLRDLYVRADLFVMPNIVVQGDMEGFGIVMLESGLCGVPTLAADLEGIRDVISEGNGRLVPSGDADLFVRAIEAQMELDVDARREASARTHAHVRDTFAWDGVTRRYVEVLRGVKARRLLSLRGA